MDALKVDGWLRKATRVVFAPRCLLCREPGHEGRDLCAACTAALPWNKSACLRCALPLPTPGLCGACLQKPPPMTETHAVFVYGFPLDRLVPRLKFHNDLVAGRLLSELMAECLSGVTPPAALVPVPLHASRLRLRGYDQALELARPLARALRVPLLPDLLVRTRATSAQSELDAGARQRNLRRAFAAHADLAMPAHVALVDDVMTTGATLQAAARTLRRAGVARVDAWVCARVP
ncbi:MAG TPA: ComF family protein [Pseudoxanthomonas sp.]|nr:ComF family protein [Pseudoxanthomonas sp.]